MMDIVELTKCVFNSDCISCSERIKVCQVVFSTGKSNFPCFNKLRDYIAQFNRRDQVTIKLTNPDDNLLYFTSTTLERDYNDYFQDSLPEDEILVNIEIDKKIVESRLSVYNYSEFSKDLLDNSLKDFITIFSSLLANLDSLIFEVFDTDIFWCTKTIAFIHDKNILFVPKIDRKERMEKSKLVSNNYSNIKVNLVPDDFCIVTDYINNTYTDKFEHIETILAMSYITSSSSMDDNQITCQIDGQRSLSFKYTYDSIVINKELYRIYDWIFTDGNPADKSIIAHNVMDVYCNSIEIINIDEKTLSSIISNYQMYLKENVNKYFEVKNKVSEYICDIAAKVGNNVTELLSSFKSNLIAVFGFLLTVLLVNIVSERPLSNIFTKDITVIVELVMIGSFVYFLICLFETIYKYRKNKEAYLELKKNYDDIFSEEELAQIFKQDRMFEKSKKTVKKGLWIYSIIWCTFIIVAIIVVECVSDSPIVSPIVVEFFNNY